MKAFSAQLRLMDSQFFKLCRLSVKIILCLMAYSSLQTVSAQTIRYDVPQNPEEFDGVYSGAVAFADIDGDGDLDLVITGEPLPNKSSTKLYMNDGAGNFTEKKASLIAVSHGSVAFADIDKDGDADLLLTGVTSSGYYSATRGQQGYHGYIEIGW